MSRSPRTTGDLWRLEFATGNDPADALIRALDELPVRGGQLWDVGIGHDDGCPSLVGGGMPACSCEVVRLEARRAA